MGTQFTFVYSGTLDENLTAHTNQTVQVVRPLRPDEADLDDVGPMYEVEAEDGIRFHVFADELFPLGQMPAANCAS